MLKRTVLIALVWVIALSSFSQAQPLTKRHSRQKQRRTEIEAKVRTMKIWKMTEELGLSEEQAIRFFPMMNNLEENLKEIKQQRRQTLEKLGHIVYEPNADAGEINKQLNELEELQKNVIELRKKFRKDVSGVLDPSQVGKMVLFNHQFPHRMRNMIREFEERDADRKHPPPRGRGW